MYICAGTVLLFLLVYILGTSIFLYLGTCTFVHGSLLLYDMHIYMCVTTAVCVCRTMFVCMALTTGQGCQSC